MKRLKSETGGTLVFVAVMLPALLLVLALVADIGMMHIVRAQLQTAADAGSLSGSMFSEDELQKEDQFLLEDGVPVAVRVYVELDPDRARARALQTISRNLLNLAGVVTVTRTSCYLPCEMTGEGGQVNYWAWIEDYDAASGFYRMTGGAVFDHMDSAEANACVVELEAQISTLLLGPLLSVFYGNENYRRVDMRVYSMSRFAHLEEAEAEG
jgi:hypothetical protein